ncbi:methyltransferase domain-containing protein [Agrobacterium vitis]|uniref:Methyltransferase domain-containing protein n=1 Tax=Agrobacterium vitis TaxID=373 RepID=A0ABD6G7P9_AGRVI|nr:class I SAM-dependent methyltransferase [Agrobacterium vitis]MUO78090.1 methyltransferase domain-containing protein [Agrobacterium vitis]MUO93968.1 methyltransferase domain-containing protein [Agrobacterium vitis]MUP03578.1 methyltransferase domain-containing protein [Agrobacterium vitis]MUZ82740.1 methyltransferase domain-containing protein [Agrobacterium vitis]MVA10081.1 methyltransferase domain-containing protein [Agrobacterium vitis]
MNNYNNKNLSIDENFDAVKILYDDAMAQNIKIHDIIYPVVFRATEYIVQFSDNSKTELKKLGDALDLPPGSRVLDIGSGRGRVAAYMAEQFTWNVTGVEISTVPMADARDYAATLESSLRNRLAFVQANIYEYSEAPVFDGVYGTGAFCHFNATRLFSHLATLLRPGARIGVMERVRLGPIPADDWDRLTREWQCPTVYTTDEYADALSQAGFENIQTIDLKQTFRIWQEKSVTVRDAMADRITSLSSRDYHEAAIAHAGYEADVTRKGLLGYVCVTATRRHDVR